MSDTVRQSRTASQRRYLTVMFTDLSGSTNMSMEMEAENYVNLMLDLHDIYSSSVESHGGAVIQMQGDGVLACFGFPDAGESDGRNAVEAALDIRDRVERLSGAGFESVALQVHSGVHSGLTLLQGLRIEQGRFNIFGATVNIAAKLSDLASGGEVIVGAESLGPERYSFEIGETRTAEVAGVARPLRVRSVLARAGERTRYQASSRRGLSRFVGCTAHLTQIAAAAERAIWVIGPTGVGKTRLVEEFLAAHRPADAQVLRARCDGVATAVPWQPVAQILRDGLGIAPGMGAAADLAALEDRIAALSPTLAPCIPALLAALAPGSVDPRRAKPATPEDIAAAVAQVLVHLARTAPQIVFIDGLQWADQASRRVIDTLCRLGDRAIFVIMTARELTGEQRDGFGDAVIELGAMAPGDAQSLSQELAPGASDFERARIIDYSGRNPLYLEDLCFSFRDNGEDRPSDPELPRDVWLAKIIEARVERLPRACARVVRAGVARGCCARVLRAGGARGSCARVVRADAVIGHEAPVWLLESVIGRALEPGVLRRLARSDFLLAQPGGVLRFTHGLTRDVICSTVAAEDRRALHGAIASRIAERHGPEGERDCCELLAAHFAGATVWDAAARFAEMSGKRAEIASVLDRARFHYGAALKHMAELEDSPARYERWMKICRRYAFACVYDAAKDQLPTFGLAVARARAHGDRLQTCKANFWLGYVLYAPGLSGRAIARLEEAACEARALGEEELCSQIAASLGQAYSSASRHDRSSDLPGQTIEVKRRYRKPGKPAVSLVYPLACMASTYGDQGRFRDAYALTDEALDGIAGAGHEVESSVLLWKSGVLLWQGRWEEAREAAAQARRVGERVKSLLPHGRGAAHEAYAGWRLVPQDDLVERLRNATGWLESGRKQLFISLSYGWLAEVMAARGAWDEMRGHAARALTCGRRSDLLGGAMAMRALARAAAEGRMAHGPEPYLARAMRNAHLRNAPHEVAETRLLEARLLCGAAGRGHGERLPDLAEAAFEEMEMPAKVAETRQARAVIAA